MSEESIKPMGQKTITGLEIIEASVLLGILGDVLLRAAPWGLNIFLWIGTLSAAIITLSYRRRQENLNIHTFSLHGALIFFAACFMWRDSTELKVLDILAVIGVLSLLVMPSLKIKLDIAGVIHYAYAGAWAGLSAAFGPFVLAFDDIKWKSIPQKGYTKHLISVLKGLAIAAPILVVFGGLFMAADAAFEGIVQKAFNIDSGNLILHGILIGFFSWITAGYLRGSLLGIFEADPIVKSISVVPQPPPSVTEEIKEPNTVRAVPQAPNKEWNWRNFDNSILPKSLTLGMIEMCIVLGLMDLLFLSFVVVQMPYLFGGMELVQSTPDFKLAEYARRGFGELVMVAALVLPILLTSHWLLRKDKPMNEYIFRILAGIQIGLLFVIMISAAQRMFLYTGNMGYGLTLQRLYPMAFMIWLAMVFIWFAMTVFRGARQQFAWGALWTGLFVLGMLHFLNPDDFVVRTNVRLMQEGRGFDSEYASGLSADAVPAILESMPVMTSEDQCTVKFRLLNRMAAANEENDFRSWNYSRWTAKRLMNANAEAIITKGCPYRTDSLNMD